MTRRMARPWCQVPAADMAAGLTALGGVLMALIGRTDSGRGDYLDIAMSDSLLPWSAHIAGSAIMGGDAPRSLSQRSLGGAAFYNIYRTADAHHIVLGGREIKFAAALLTALDRPDLLPIAERDAGEQGVLIAFLRETFGARCRDEWVTWFADKDIAFAPVLDYREALDAAHVSARGLWDDEADGAHHIAPAIRFAGDD